VLVCDQVSAAHDVVGQQGHKRLVEEFRPVLTGREIRVNKANENDQGSLAVESNYELERRVTL